MAILFEEYIPVHMMLCAAFSDHVARLSDETMEAQVQLYHRMLCDLELCDLEAVALRHMAESQWFPKIAELRKSAASLTHPEALDPVEAWEQVRLAILRTGSYGVPEFDDPLTGAIVRQMGWRDLCLSENPVADRARFIEAYERQAARSYQRAALPAGLQNGALAGARRVDQLTAGVVKQLSGGSR